MWFQLYLPPDQPHFTLSEIHQFIKAYISRHDIEMEQLRAERANLPSTRKIVKSKREELIEATKQKDESEYKTGFEVPDLRSAKTVKSLRYVCPGELGTLNSDAHSFFFIRYFLSREWQGDFNAVRMIKTIRLRMDGENKGLSKSSDMITNTRNDAVSSLQNDQMNE